MEQLGDAEFCKILPKLELHAHLNGSLSEKTLEKLGSSSEDINEYRKLSNISINQRTLNDCFKIFHFAHKVTTSPDKVYEATKCTIQEYIEDNVVYLELRTTPRCDENTGMSLEDYTEAVVKAIKENNEILVKLILSINRQSNMEICTKNLEHILKMNEKYPDIIKGIDLSGNPHHGNFNELKPLFLRAHQFGLYTTIHCGEIENNDEVEEILNFKPDRIGHAPFLHPNYGGCSKNWIILNELKIPTEFCLTSNIVSGTTKTYKEHHIKEWISENLQFSLNTDDKGVFNTTLSEEFHHALKYFNLTRAELLKISYNSIQHSFGNTDEKMELKRILDHFKEKTQI